jgi:hypothetical protein
VITVGLDRLILFWTKNILRNRKLRLVGFLVLFLSIENRRIKSHVVRCWEGESRILVLLTENVWSVIIYEADSGLGSKLGLEIIIMILGSHMVLIL